MIFKKKKGGGDIIIVNMNFSDSSSCYRGKCNIPAVSESKIIKVIQNYYRLLFLELVNFRS